MSIRTSQLSPSELALILFCAGLFGMAAKSAGIPKFQMGLGVVLVVAFLLELTALAPKSEGPITCGVAAGLAALPVRELGPGAAILVALSIAVVRSLRFYRIPRLTLDSLLHDLFPLALASFALSMTSTSHSELERKLAMSSLLALVSFFLVTSLLRTRSPKELMARRRYFLAGLIASLPLALLLDTKPQGAVFLIPLLFLVQRGGYGITLEERQDQLVTITRELKDAQGDKRRASRVEQVKERDLKRMEVDKQLLEGLHVFFSRNPNQEAILDNLLAAVERILQQAPVVVFAVREREFKALRWSRSVVQFESKLQSPVREPLFEDCLKQRRILPCAQRKGSQESWLAHTHTEGGIVVPLASFGVLIAQTSEELSERQSELLLNLATQVGLGLQGARYRGELEKALLERTQAYQSLTESQAQLVQSGKMAAVGQLAAGLAHELNSPLAAVLLQLQSAQLRIEKSPDKARTSLRVAERATGKAQKIIEKLLFFSRPSIEQRIPVQVVDLIEETMEMVGPQLKQRKVAIEIESGPGRVCGDPLELQQVLTNLLLNAGDAASENSHSRPAQVRVRVQSGDPIIIAVEDSGRGIDQDILSRIFEPFFSTKQVGEGTGLGLSISYQIAEAHGGTLRCENLPDGGARFEVAIPSHRDSGTMP